MDEAHKKAAITRQRNQEAQRIMYQEKGSSYQGGAVGLQRVMENAEATPEQILEAVRLWAEIGR